MVAMLDTYSGQDTCLVHQLARAREPESAATAHRGHIRGSLQIGLPYPFYSLFITPPLVFSVTPPIDKIDKCVTELYFGRWNHYIPITIWKTTSTATFVVELVATVLAGPRTALPTVQGPFRSGAVTFVMTQGVTTFSFVLPHMTYDAKVPSRLGRGPHVKHKNEETMSDSSDKLETRSDTRVGAMPKSVRITALSLSKSLKFLETLISESRWRILNATASLMGSRRWAKKERREEGGRKESEGKVPV
ncbi:hypothetical protein L210DRAFT_3626816 [Boletus edulis BED1]|uniref:Uncharacterized protein n=1 Tax=Boletus edulis BED1 TaxID=1328754 RepID=A0AAD4C9B6_BOLED|nr:hypothetical protein L210DRAFT_3626816 [Boletus edulis BED1]